MIDEKNRLQALLKSMLDKLEEQMATQHDPEALFHGKQSLLGSLVTITDLLTKIDKIGATEPVEEKSGNIIISESDKALIETFLTRKKTPQKTWCNQTIMLW